MTIPGADQAVVDATKLRDYLLSTEHPVGRFKAAFFARLGYSRQNWRALQAKLERLAMADDAMPGALSEYGQKFEVRATLEGPSGRQATIVVVWVVLSGEGFPRLVTAFPGDSR